MSSIRSRKFEQTDDDEMRKLIKGILRKTKMYKSKVVS